MGQFSAYLRFAALGGLALLVAACAQPEPTRGIFDPYESGNRATHEFNLALDRTILKPTSTGYGTIVPKPVRTGVSNFSSNLGLPSVVVNNLLQLNINDAVHNTMRFAFNSTFGLGGVLDPATDAGLHERTTDFGQTLHVWGAAEGAYIVLPLLGPTTERDMVGKVVNLFTNPITYVLPSPERYVGTGAAVLARVGDRYEFASAIDSILYDSADSYAQTRIIFLENRRFELGEGGDEDYFDPYDDIYLE